MEGKFLLLRSKKPTQTLNKFTTNFYSVCIFFRYIMIIMKY
jgi:hypothetical protein